MTKICAKCGIEKPRTDYYVRARRTAGRCKVCYNLHRLVCRQAFPKRYMLESARTRAKARGLPCTITESDFDVPSHCPILGIPLSVKYGSRGASDNSPSLDAIDPSKGYVSGNVQVLSQLANQMKNSATLEQCVMLGEWARRALYVC